MRSTPCIDAHLHVFAKESKEFPRKPNDICPADKEATIETFLSVMEEHQIDQAMLVQIGGTLLEYHAYLRHCLKTYPDRFLGIGLIPPDCDTPEEHMDRLAGDGQIVGFRLSNLGGPTDPFADIDIRKFKTYPIWKHCAEKDFVLWLYPSATSTHLLPHLIDAFPQVRIVFNHLAVMPGVGKFSLDALGRPMVDTVMPPPTRFVSQNLSRYENVTVLVSGHTAFSKEPYPYEDLKTWHTSLLTRYGAERLMWATDFPWIMEDPGYGKLTEIVGHMYPEISSADRDAIMGGTARRFLRFPRTDSP